MKIYLASDHAGFELKKHLVDYLQGAGFDAIDCGPKKFEPTDDYPDFISLAAREVSKDPKESRGIVLGLSGQGEMIVANKFANVRCGLFNGGADEIVKLMREHNDANMLSLGAKFLTQADIERVVELWLETAFSNEPRHARRIEKISELEKKNGLRK